MAEIDPSYLHHLANFPALLVPVYSLMLPSLPLPALAVNLVLLPTIPWVPGVAVLSEIEELTALPYDFLAF